MLYRLNDEFTKINQVEGLMQNMTQNSRIEVVACADNPQKDSGILLLPMEKLKFTAQTGEYIHARCAKVDGTIANLSVVNFKMPVSDETGTGCECTNKIDDNLVVSDKTWSSKKISATFTKYYTKAEVDALVGSGCDCVPEIDDNITSVNKTWSSEKISTMIGSGTAGPGDYAQVTKLGVTASAVAPKLVQIPITPTVSFCRPPAEILKYVQKEQSVVTTLCEFDNADANDFMIDGVSGEYAKYVEFDGTMYPKTKYEIQMSVPITLGSGYVSESEGIDLAKFKRVGNILQNDIVWDNDSYISGIPQKYAIGSGCKTKNPLPKNKVIKFTGHCKVGYCYQMALTKLPVKWYGDSTNCALDNSIRWGKEDYGQPFNCVSRITGTSESIYRKTINSDYDYEVLIDPINAKITLTIEGATYEYTDANRDLFDGDDVYLVCYRASQSYSTKADTVDLSGIVQDAVHVIYLKQNEAWGMENGIFKMLSNNYNALSDTDKEQLFLSINHEKAAITDLESLQQFAILNYTAAQDNLPVYINAVPKNQMILPKGLISLESFEGIDQAMLTADIKSSVPLNLRFDENGTNDLSRNTWSSNGVDYSEPGKFGGKAVKINATAYLESPDSSKWNFAQDDFTISLWIKPNTLSKGVIIAQRNNGTHFCPVQLGIEPNGLYLQISSDLNSWNIIQNIPYSLSVGSWYHVALVNSNNTFTVYVDGQNIYSCVSERITADSTDPMRIGNSGTGNLNGVDCYIDDICITNKALWLSDFTPPANYLIKNAISCKLLVTTDLATYYTYDFRLQDWQPIDHANLVEVEQRGIYVSQLKNINRVAWDKLMNGKIGIGFAYLLSIEDTADVCKVDKLELQIDMKGSWKKAAHGTDYDYEYPANNALWVSLLANGNYKINYQK